jgi:hypothetical protein
MCRARKGRRGSPRKRFDARWQSRDDAEALIGGEAVRRSAVSSYDIRKEGKRSDATRLKRGDASTALTVKGVEVVAEIRNLARGVELRC